MDEFKEPGTLLVVLGAFAVVGIGVLRKLPDLVVSTQQKLLELGVLVEAQQSLLTLPGGVAGLDLARLAVLAGVLLLLIGALIRRRHASMKTVP